MRKGERSVARMRAAALRVGVRRLSDGTTATGATASVTYTAPGTYTAGLTVSDSAGNWTATGAPSVQVYPRMPMP